MKNFLYVLALGLLVGCQLDNLDSQKAHIFEDIALKGTVYLRDSFVESPTVIAPGATVYLYDGDTTGNYVLKTQTDKDGKFSFLYQPKPGESANINLVAEFTDKNAVLFRKVVPFTSFTDSVNAGNDSLNLSARYPKGSLKVKTTDSNKELINGVTVFLFVNKTQAQAAQKSDPTATAIRSYTSTERGIAFFSNLEASTYYVLGRKGAQCTDISSITVIAPGSTTALRSYTTVTGPVASTTAVTAVSPLSLSLVSVPITVQLTVYVTADTIPPPSLIGIDVYLLNSLAGVDLTIPISSTLTKKTDSQGKAEFSDVPPGTYFVAARGTFFRNGTNGATVVKAGIASSPVSATLSSAIPVTFTSTTAVSSPASVTVVIDGG